MDYSEADSADQIAGPCVAVQALTDANEGVQVPEFEGGSGQSVEAPKQVRNVGVATVPVRRKFLPEGHWPAVSLDRLIDVGEACPPGSGGMPMKFWPDRRRSRSGSAERVDSRRAATSRLLTQRHV
ncbi:hypothetical protein [Streptomyces sp. NPDC001340]